MAYEEHNELILLWIAISDMIQSVELMFIVISKNLGDKICLLFWMPTMMCSTFV